MVNLLNIQNYWAYWYGIRKGCATDKDAWEVVEEDMEQMYGFGQYDSYDAFRVAKMRYTIVLKDIITKDIDQTNLADVMTVPGYMENYWAYRTQNDMETPDSVLWKNYQDSLFEAFGVRMYENYESFRKARQRYIQGIRNRNHKIWKTKVKI